MLAECGVNEYKMWIGDMPMDGKVRCVSYMDSRVLRRVV
jgi:hypothetical protein